MIPGKITREVSFTGQNGIVKHYNKEGVKIDSVFTRDEIEASFRGGDVPINIKRNILNEMMALMKDGQSGELVGRSD